MKSCLSNHQRISKPTQSVPINSIYSAVHLIQTPGEPTKFVLIMTCSNYEFALNIKCKYNVLSRDHNHLSELKGFLK